MALRRHFFTSAFLFIFGGICQGDESKQDSLTLARKARPILSENCFQCHGPAEQKADLRLDQPNPAVVPDKPEDSELVTRIHETDPDEIMPPPDSHKSLSTEDKKLLENWISSGARYVSHWSFEPIIDSATRIDDAIGNRQNEAPPGRLIRRLSLDLTGLPPAIDAVEQFERGEITYESLVDRFLASPRYGEHRARFWLDAARYSDTHGLQNDYFRAIWPYRQWVIDAFNTNLPFDEFSIRQLAGDLLPDGEKDPIATGFLKCNPSTHEGGVIQEEYRVKYLMDRTDTVATTWLGLTAGCAACHDHKFDPISMKDYYSLSAFFAPIEEPVMNGDRAYNGPIAYLPLGPNQDELEKLVQWSSNPEFAPTTHLDVFGKDSEPFFAGQAASAQTVAFWSLPPESGTIQNQSNGRGAARHGYELIRDANGHLLLRLIGKKKDGKAGKREFRTEAPTPLEGLTHFAITADTGSNSFAVFLNGSPVPMKETVNDLEQPVLSKAPRRQSFLTKVSHLPVPPRFLTFSRYDRVLTLGEIGSLARVDPALQEAMAKIKAVACSIVAKESAPKSSHILIGGAYDSKGDEVTAATLTALPPMPDFLPRNRLGLAQWLFLKKNPLTARVAVNRIWAQFFGEGFCKTQNDLGNQGALPHHPELFDSLAADFKKDWDIKRLIKRLVMSQTYRQSSMVASGKSRAHRLRLDGETLRDQALAIGGLLVLESGGPPVSPYQPNGIWRAVSVDISDSKQYRQSTGTELYRRSVYTVHKRTAGPPIMMNFDAPSREVCSVQREVTNTPLQALQLMNDVQFVEAARGLAARALNHPDPVRRMFKLATYREPDRDELKVLESLLKQFKSADTEALAKLGESSIKAPGPYVMLATTLLNTDEVLCR